MAAARKDGGGKKFPSLCLPTFSLVTFCLQNRIFFRSRTRTNPTTACARVSQPQQETPLPSCTHTPALSARSEKRAPSVLFPSLLPPPRLQAFRESASTTRTTNNKTKKKTKNEKQKTKNKKQNQMGGEGLRRICAPCESASSKGSIVWALCCLISIGQGGASIHLCLVHNSIETCSYAAEWRAFEKYVNE